MINPIVKTIELMTEEPSHSETGKLANRQTVLYATHGNTMLLATVCAAKDAVPEQISCLCR